nr:hypothetical protein CFP56_51374 [Quercus suber]
MKLKANDMAISIMYNLGLVGKILVDKIINKNVVKAILLKAWNTAKGVQIVDLSDNIYLFKFAIEGDRKRLIELGPWNIEGFPFILKQWDQKLHLKYERVVDFCFKCGGLGHVKFNCSSQVQKMLNELQGFGPWMKAETQGKRTSRWVEFLSEICNEDEDSNNLELTRSPPSATADDVEHVMNSDETGKHINSPDSLGTLIVQLPINFESLVSLVTSNPVHLEKLINLHNQTQPGFHAKCKENNPINTYLIQTALNSLIPMDIDQTEALNPLEVLPYHPNKINHPTYSQPISNQTQNPRNIKS